MPKKVGEKKMVAIPSYGYLCDYSGNIQAKNRRSCVVVIFSGSGRTREGKFNRLADAFFKMFPKGKIVSSIVYKNAKK